MNLVDNLKLPIMVFAVLILAIYPIVSHADSSATKPILEIPSPRHDAGTHWEGEVVSHTYQVTNSGSEELRILSVKPGWGCSVVRYDRTIPPGGVGQVTLQVNTSGFRGGITKSAQVTTNDPKQRQTKIYLSMNVRAHIIVEPGPKILLRGFVGDDIRRTVRIRANDDRPLEITKVQSNLGSAIDYKLNRKGDSHQYELEVVSKATDRKTASGFITLRTNHPKKKVLKLSVHLRVKPEIQAWPNRIVFYEEVKPESKRKESKRVLTIMNNRGKSFRIQELNYNKDYFQVRSLAKNGNPAKRYQFAVTPLLDKLPAGRIEFRDTLIIRTDNARGGELQVPMLIKLKK